VRPSAGNHPPGPAESLGRGELVRLAYRLARSHATGVLTLSRADAVGRGKHGEVLILRRGQLMTSESDGGRTTATRLERLVAEDGLRYRFDGGVAAYPPGAPTRQFSLAAWARHHLESQLDSTRAHRLVAELAGVRLGVRADLAPEPNDDTDRRILAAMRQPRRLDQIWPLARTPRFRLLTFIHFLRAVGALTQVGVAAPAPEPEAVDAHRMLGVPPQADRETVKRAYRRLARVLHPDLNGGESAERRRVLERRLADITTAYRQLTGS
jgi:DnaJ-domain-containing protein 1